MVFLRADSLSLADGVDRLQKMPYDMELVKDHNGVGKHFVNHISEHAVISYLDYYYQRNDNVIFITSLGVILVYTKKRERCNAAKSIAQK